ncbi:hypothetical protein OEZ85_003460 [Tetradesmus obliquus]|uniref:Uncharacterized protein n=1 Tax=Tetradesmus obliquus TaxID=3088 RepID=A0ABY8UBL1_TETOB|nr:hypothetical protein OEZ85_003460 [Tetradesmus obliquus]
MANPTLEPLDAFKAALDDWQQHKEDSSRPWRDTRMWTHGHKQQAAGGTSQPRLAGAVEAGKPLVIHIDTRRCLEADEAAICQQLQRIDMSEAKVLMLRMRNLPPQLHSGSPLGLHCGQLRCLELSQNNLARLPPWVPQQQHLRLLDLSDCGQLEMLPQEFGQLTSLVNLNLSGCHKLASLPESIGCLQALQVLDMGSSGVTELPASFGNLYRLHTLFAPCLLATLPDSFGQLNVATNPEDH